MAGVELTGERFGLANEKEGRCKNMKLGQVGLESTPFVLVVLESHCVE